MRPLRIAVLDEELPFPLNSGKRMRTFNLLRRLAHRHRITILCHRGPTPRETAEAEAALRHAGIETVIVDHVVPPKSGPAFYARLAGNLVSSLPYSVASHASTSLAEAVRRHAAENRVDIWHVEWTPYAQVLRDALGPRLARTRWTVIAHNVESLIWQRQAEAEANPLKRWFIRQQWQKFERFERWVYAAAPLSVAVSRDDARLMRDRFDATKVEVVDNGVDTAYFHPQRDVERDPARILFLGSLDWRPNLDGVRILLDTVFPDVSRQAPQARLAIVGRNPPDWLRDRVGTMPNVELFADVPDVRPFLAGCGMLAVPLRIGGGSRLKILEALATGTPVVSTRIGAEGLRLVPGRDLMVVQHHGEMAEAITAGISRPDLLQETADSGRDKVLRTYDWDTLAERLAEVWLVLATDRVPAGR
jgi:glycosyltransferase involved in cell wall biosynthesis